VAIEATTGWRWVWRELVECGFEVRLAEPVQTRALLGHRRSAKTDRLDARWLARLLAKEMLEGRQYCCRLFLERGLGVSAAWLSRFSTSSCGRCSERLFVAVVACM